MKFIPYIMIDGSVYFFRACFDKYEHALLRAHMYLNEFRYRESGGFGAMPVPAEKAEKVKESRRWAKTVAFN